jgi:hypothetical protein
VKNGNGKTARKTAKLPKPALVAQPNGKGALYAGGVPGNRGNRHAVGPPASVIRERCRGSFDQRVPILEQIADGSFQADPSDRLKAVDILGKYGLDARTQMGVDEVKERLRATLTILREELGPAVAERIIQRIRGEWAA